VREGRAGGELQKRDVSFVIPRTFAQWLQRQGWLNMGSGTKES